MSKEASITVPVCFIDEAPLRRLAVDEEGIWEVLGLNNGQRSVRAKKDASYRFRTLHSIRTLPGGVYSLYEIQAALRRAADKRVAGGAR